MKDAEKFAKTNVIDKRTDIEVLLTNSGAVIVGEEVFGLTWATFPDGSEIGFTDKNEIEVN